MAILDKEFLTFCNATNLDWHFADYESKKGVKPKLHELLDPEKFKRRNKKEEFTGFVYMPNAKNEKTVSAQDKKEGLIAMQARAGVLMNYLEECEKGSGQGDFLKEWEVVYALDNYQLAEDYMDLIIEEADCLVKNLKKQQTNDEHLENAFKSAVVQTYAEITGDDLSTYSNVSIDQQWGLQAIYKMLKPLAEVESNLAVEKLKKEFESKKEIYTQLKNSIKSREEIKESLLFKERLEMAFSTVKACLKVLTYVCHFSSISSNNNNIKDANIELLEIDRAPMEHKVVKNKMSDYLQKNPNVIKKKNQQLEGLKKTTGGLNYKKIEGDRKKLKVELNNIENEYYLAVNVEKMIDDTKKEFQYIIEVNENLLQTVADKFLESVIGNAIGSAYASSVEKKSVSSSIATMAIALFTRANFFDFAGTAMDEAKEFSVAKYQMDLFICPPELKGSKQGFEQSFELFDTGFRLVLFKNAENQLVLACKGDTGANKGIISKGVNRIKIAKQLIAKRFPNLVANMKLTGYGSGAKLLFDYNLTENKCSNNTILFYDKDIKILSDLPNFTVEDFKKNHEPDIKFFSTVASKSSYLGLGYLLSLYMKNFPAASKNPIIKKVWSAPGDLIYQTVSKSKIFRSLNALKITNFWSFLLVELLTTFAFYLIEYYTKKAEDEENILVYKKFKENLWIEDNKEKSIKGQVSEKYYDSESFICDGVVYEKEFGFYKSFKLKTSALMTSVQGLSSGSDVRYILYRDEIGQNSTKELYYYVLKKVDNIHYYKGAMKVIHFGTSTVVANVVGEYETSKIKGIFGKMDLIGSFQSLYQENYLNNKGNKFIYIDYDKVSSSNTMPQSNKLYYSKYYLGLYVPERYINDYIFLPYMKNDGNIGTELRVDYIKNACKDIINLMCTKELFNHNTKNEMDLIVKFIMERFERTIPENQTYKTINKIQSDEFCIFRDAIVYFSPKIYKNDLTDIDFDSFITIVRDKNNKPTKIEMKMGKKDMRYGFAITKRLYREDRVINLSDKEKKGFKIVVGTQEEKIIMKGGYRLSSPN